MILGASGDIYYIGASSNFSVATEFLFLLLWFLMIFLILKVNKLEIVGVASMLIIPISLYIFLNTDLFGASVVGLLVTSAMVFVGVGRIVGERRRRFRDKGVM